MRLYDRDQEAGIRPEQRERPQMAHHSVHTTREAEETRVDIRQEFNADHAFNPTSLKAPPPRAGFKQRWVTDGTNPMAEKSEQRNWFAKRRMGWQVRHPETVPEVLRDLYPSSKLTDGTDAIRIAGSVLCEMPIQVARQYRDAVQDRIQHQSKAIPESTEELRRRERAGVGPLEVTDQSSTYRGRRAASFK